MAQDGGLDGGITTGMWQRVCLIPSLNRISLLPPLNRMT